jgi:hypothetical protein
MTAAIAGAAAAEGAGAGAAGAGAEGASTAASRAAPSASAPTGTAPSTAGSPAYKAKTKKYFDTQPKKMPTGGSSGSSGGGASKSSTTKAKTGAGVTTGKTTTTRAGKSTSTSTTKRSFLPAFLGGGSKKSGLLDEHSGQRLLVVEFIACALILGFSPLTSKHREDTPGSFMKRGTAICALFLVLGLVGSGGPRAAKASAAFGGLVTLALLLSDADVLVVIADRFKAPVTSGPAGPGSAGPTGPGGPLGGAPLGGGPPDTSGLGIPLPPDSGNWWDWILRGLGPI